MKAANPMNRRSALLTIAGALFSLGYGSSALAQGRGEGNNGTGNGGGNGNGNGGGNGNAGGGNGNGGGNNGNGGGNGNGNAGGNPNSNAGGNSANAGGGNPPSASAPSSVSMPVPGERAAEEHDLVLRAVEEGRAVPMRNLMAQIEAKFRADVIDAKLRNGRNGLIYELKMLSDQGRVFVVSVDAATGLP